MNKWSGPLCRATTGRVCGPRKTIRAWVDWSSHTRTAEPSRNQLRLQLALAGKQLRCSLSAAPSTRRTTKPRTHASNVARASNLRSDESLTKRNKAVVRAYLGEIAQRGTIVARERYFTSTTTFNGEPDLARQFARIGEVRRAFPDLEMTIEQQIAEGPGWERGSPTVARTRESLPACPRRADVLSMRERPWIAWKTERWLRCGTP